jgi:hypothetical protein
MRPSENRLRLWPFAVIAFFAMLAALSLDLSYELRASAPEQFRRVPALSGHADPALADEYWKLAGNVVQWKYPFGNALPSNPPHDFALPAESLRKKEWASDSAKFAYWTELKREWPRPEAWRRTAKLDPSWAGRTARTTVDFVSDFFRRST